MSPIAEKQILIMALIEYSYGRDVDMTLEEILASLKSLEKTTEGIISTSPRGVQNRHTGNFEMDLGEALDSVNITGSKVIVDTGIVSRYRKPRNAWYHFNMNMVVKDLTPREMNEVFGSMQTNAAVSLSS